MGYLTIIGKYGFRLIEKDEFDEVLYGVAIHMITKSEVHFGVHGTEVKLFKGVAGKNFRDELFTFLEGDYSEHLQGTYEERIDEVGKFLAGLEVL